MVWRHDTRPGQRKDLQMPGFGRRRRDQAEGAWVYRRLRARPYAVLASRINNTDSPRDHGFPAAWHSQTTTLAAFSKASRIKFANPTKLYVETRGTPL